MIGDINNAFITDKDLEVTVRRRHLNTSLTLFGGKRTAVYGVKGNSMKVSTRSRYGVRLLMDIAMNSHGQAVSLHEVADRQDISLKYLEKITRLLKQAGYLSSKRGPNGGHRLTKPAEEIYLGDVVRVLEGDLDLVNCWMDETACPRMGHCKTHHIWTELTDIIYKKLNSLTLADLIENDVCAPSSLS